MDSSAPQMQEAEGCPVAHGNEKDILAESSLTDARILAHPNAYYTAMRHEDPVHFDEKLGMWLVSRYEDIAAVSRSPNIFSMEKGYQGIYAGGFADEFKAILERDGQGFFPDAIMSDPPYHTRVRRLMDHAFTAHRVKELEPRIAQVVGDLIDKMADKGEADAVNEFAVPMTIAIICEQLGFDHFDGHKIQEWSHAVTAQISALQSREDMRKHAAQICDLQNFLIGHIRDREQNPKEDMISDLVHAHAEGDPDPALNFKEVVSLVRALLIAGNETTATGLGNLFFILATQPDVAKLLYDAVDNDDDRLVTRFVEELLRIEPPVRGLSRMTTEEVELGGTLLPANAPMLLLFASGNDDETVFECPRKFDMERGNLGKQIAFGTGTHRCIGIALARMEIKVAAREVAKRLKDIKLAIPLEDIRYLPTVATRSLERLPITFSRR